MTTTTTTTTTAADLSAVAAVATVGAVAFIDDLNAVSLIRAAGDAYDKAGGVFFKVSAAAILRVGDEKARGIAKDIWPDSKHKSREYFLKVARAILAAQKEGNADKIPNVATFAALMALGKPAKTAEPEAASEQSQQQAIVHAATLHEQAVKASGEISRLNKAMGALEVLEAVAVKAANAATNADDTAAAALVAAGIIVGGDLRHTTKQDMAGIIAALLAERARLAGVLVDGAETIGQAVANVRAAVTSEEAPADQPAPELQSA